MFGLVFIESWFPILSIVAMSYVGALHTYAYALMVALVFFFVIMKKRKRFSELKNREAYKDLLLTSFWITSLFALIFIGIQYTTAGNMAVIMVLQLLFSYLYFNVLGKEKMSTKHIVGAAIMGVGALLILIPDDLSFNKGDLLILLAAIIAPIANLFQKRARNYCSAETILGFRTLVGLPFIGLLAYIYEAPTTYNNFMLALPYILIIGVAVYVVSKIMWIEALHRISITKVSAMMSFMPVMTLFFAYLYLGEVPEFRQMLGIIPVLIGGYLLTRPIKVNN
ncbi:hypothetical protein MNB_SV-5-134 [hydrothermal vent metagenome]|uniref:EamA domain-containing protein n=1 Tax=hydrothermal vent metagenome TaxID=652676 RepID=A0A1W1ECL5_9ZZZZ